ncbi:MAG: hypothetical protein B7Y15_12490 [Bacteroidetes bacterium 24-39-8]|nr:MAG: hypothetical protein B7Y15_12490 [Bacteroidetes bacterium 24-39-8]OZA63554.1 MAG: hypothetical protein B7X72_10220 [Sphingobacteriia bacterium 39-39-8]
MATLAIMNFLRSCFLLFFLFQMDHSMAQSNQRIGHIRMFGDVNITIDYPIAAKKVQPIQLIFFALPNGNSTAWTMGKKKEPGDDWHFDIQHIQAQTAFIRNALPSKSVVVVYLENDQKSWPAWKQKHPDFLQNTKHLIDSIGSLFLEPEIHLNGHSGGGSFIFAYLKAVDNIPQKIKRISFLDSDYNYDSSYYNKLHDWLKNKSHQLRVFAYNDSIALYNGKPVVSATGGTWYRSKKMLADLSNEFQFHNFSTDSILIYKSKSKQIQFFLKTNPERKILHTKQVELNGFIHSELSGTKMDSKQYIYYGNRAYEAYLKN